MRLFGVRCDSPDPSTKELYWKSAGVSTPAESPEHGCIENLCVLGLGMATVEPDSAVPGGSGTRRYRSPLRRMQAAQTRAVVLEAATRLFAERGWAGTGVRISRGPRRFPSKPSTRHSDPRPTC